MVLGTLDRYVISGESEIFYVTHYDLYPGNDPEKHIHDIAVLHLNRFISDKNDAVAPISLSKNPVKNGTICQVTGWGLTEDVRNVFFY